MNKTINILDAITLTSGATGISLSMEIQSWIGIICSAISLISICVSVVLRIVNAVKNAKDPKSDGGEKITDEELKEIANTTATGAKEIGDKAEEIKGEIDNGRK